MKIKKKFSSAAEIIKKIGAGDVFVIGGLGLMGWGIWLYSPALAMIITGALIMFFGIFLSLPPIRRSR